MIKKTISKNAGIIKPTTLLKILTRTAQFRFVPNKIKKIIIESIFKNGLTSISRKDLIEILSKDFHLAFKDYPFTQAELSEFFRIARLEKNLEAGASLLHLQFPDMNQHILSLKKINGIFKKESYQYLFLNEKSLSAEAKKHLEKLID